MPFRCKDDNVCHCIYFYESIYLVKLNETKSLSHTLPISLKWKSCSYFQLNFLKREFNLKNQSSILIIVLIYLVVSSNLSRKFLVHIGLFLIREWHWIYDWFEYCLLYKWVYPNIPGTELPIVCFSVCCSYLMMGF